MISVVLVDDHQIVREGLRNLLSSQPDIAVVAEAADGRAAVLAAKACKPSVVVMDVSLKDLNGIEATRQIREGAPQTRIIALSMHSDTRFVVGMLRAGATGYLLKDCAFEELVRAIRHAVDDNQYLSPAIASRVCKMWLDKDAEPESDQGVGMLTPRAREVLQLVAEGHSTKQIGMILGVSTKTVECHRQQIKRKLGIRTVAELTRYAIRQGLTPLEE